MTIQTAHPLPLFSFSLKPSSVLYSPYNLPLLANLWLLITVSTNCLLFTTERSTSVFDQQVMPITVSFFKFSFSSIVLCSSVLWWVLQKHPDICISIAPPDFSLKLFLAVMPTGYLWCAKSSVHLADKTVSLYILSIIYILSLSSS